MDGPVYPEPAKTNIMVTNDIIHDFQKELFGPFIIIRRTIKLIRNVNTPSAIAPLCKSTFSEGPPSMCLYDAGMSSMIARAPPTAPAAWAGNRIDMLIRLSLPTPKAKAAAEAVGFQVAPPMTCPRKENRNTSRNNREVVISSVMGPCTPKFEAMIEVPAPRHDAPNTHRNVIAASPIASLTIPIFSVGKKWVCGNGIPKPEMSSP